MWLPTSPAPEIRWPLPAGEVLLELKVSFRRGCTDNKLRESWIMARGDTLLTSDQLQQTDSDFAGPF